MSKGQGLRATTGVRDTTSIGGKKTYPTFATPNNNIRGPSVMVPLNHINNILQAYNALERELAEIGRAYEKEMITKSIEADVPSGQEVEVTVNGYQPGKGFETVVVNPVGQLGLRSDDKESLGRPQTFKVVGKGNSSKVDSDIGVLPAGVSHTSGVDYVPSSHKTEYYSKDGKTRIEGRRTDTMSGPERDFYDHPDRRLA